MTRSRRLSVEALESRNLLASGVVTYLAIDDPRGAIPNATAKFNEFVATLRIYGVDTIEGYAGFTPDPTLTFGGVGITALTDVNYVAPFAALAVSGNNSLYDQGPGTPAGADIPDVFTFSAAITAFGLFLSNTGDALANTLTFHLENTVTGASKPVVAGTFGPTASYDNVVFFGVTDTQPFNRVRMTQSYDYDGTLLDNITAGFVNVPANAGGPYSVSEGNSLNLNANPGGGPVPDGYAFSWDVNGDGVFTDASGVAPTLSWSQLTALGVNDGPAAGNVRVRVTDGVTTTTSSPVALSIVNAAPSASITPQTAIVRGAPTNFTVAASDPSSADQAATFSYDIDWNNDGAYDQTVLGSGGGVSVSHTFTTAGAGVIGVRATDKDGGVGAKSTQNVNVVSYAKIGADLYLGGTTGDDFYSFWGIGGADIGVITNDLGVFRVDGVTGAIRVFLQAGADTLTIERGNNSRAFVIDGGEGFNIVAPLSGSDNTITYMGGAGTDQFFLVAGPNNSVTFSGGGGDDVFLDVSGDPSNHVSVNGGDGNDGAAAGPGTSNLNGGDGNDMLVSFGGATTLVGGSGDDFLVGGPGAANINGGSGSDLIVAGALVFLPDITDGYLPIWAEWGSSGHSFAARVANISAGNLGGLNDPYAIVNGSTAFDNGVIDTILGGADPDWLLYKFTQDLAADYTLGVDARTNLG